MVIAIAVTVIIVQEDMATVVVMAIAVIIDITLRLGCLVLVWELVVQSSFKMKDTTDGVEIDTVHMILELERF